MEIQESNKASIMVVDDMPANLRLLEGVLHKSGYLVFPFTDAEIALGTLESNKPDLFILDIQMPEIDGLEMCRRLKKKTIFEDAPVLFISGQMDNKTKEKVIAAGGTDIISKPFRVAEILGQVERHLHAGKNSREKEH